MEVCTYGLFVGDSQRISLTSIAFFLDNPPAKPVVPLGLRSPELVLTGKVDKTLDVWSFGCLVFELVTGQPLFCVTGPDHADDGHLLTLTERIGPLPDGLYQHRKTTGLYFTPERKLFNCELGGVPDGREPLMLVQQSMEEVFDETNPNISEEEALQVKNLLRWILDYDPAKRPSPADVLLHPWFTELEGETASP